MKWKKFADDPKSRRSVLISAGTAMGAAVLPTTTSAGEEVLVSSPERPDEFVDNPLWEYDEERDVFDPEQGQEFERTGFRIRNTKAAEIVNTRFGIKSPVWRCYAWTFRRLGSAPESDDEGSGLISDILNQFIIKTERVNIDLEVDWLFDPFGEDKSLVGAAALTEFDDRIQSEYGIKSTDADCEDGLYGDDGFWLLGCSDEQDFANPSADELELFSVQMSKEFAGGIVEYVAHLVVQSYDGGDTYTVTGAIYPKSFDDGSLIGGTTTFDELVDIDPFTTSRRFMKNTK